MGQAVLANQFLAGLHPELKGKLAEQECTFDQLLARAGQTAQFSGESDRRSTGIISYLPGSRTAGGSVPDGFTSWKSRGMGLH